MSPILCSVVSWRLESIRDSFCWFLKGWQSWLLFVHWTHLGEHGERVQINRFVYIEIPYVSLSCQPCQLCVITKNSNIFPRTSSIPQTRVGYLFILESLEDGADKHLRTDVTSTQYTACLFMHEEISPLYWKPQGRDVGPPTQNCGKFQGLQEPVSIGSAPITMWSDLRKHFCTIILEIIAFHINLVFF